MSVKIDQLRSDTEIQVLHYLLKDASYIQETFGKRNIPLEYFSDLHVRKIVRDVINYYEKYGKILIKNEFEKILDEQISSKDITDIEQYAFLSTYNSAKDWDLKEEQFKRIYEDFLNISAKDQIINAVSKYKDILYENRSFDYAEKLIEELELIRRLKKEYDGIDTIDLINDVDRQIEQIIKRRDHPEEYVGTPCGIESIDEKFVGFERGTVTAVGAMVNTGKSTFVMNISNNIVRDYNKNVLAINLEMPIDQISMKYMSGEWSVPYSDLRRGDKSKISDAQIEDLRKKMEERKKEAKGSYKAMFIPAKAYTWREILAEKEKRFPAYDPDILVIDYLALIDFEERYGEDRRDVALGNLVKDIRAYAQINRLAVILVVQANRSSVMKKGGKREIQINIENIEDSNKIGAHVDNFIALYTKEGEPYTLFVKLVKQREGEKDVVIPLTARMDICKIYDQDENFVLSAKDAEDEEPSESDTGLQDAIQSLRSEYDSTSFDEIEKFDDEGFTNPSEDEDDDDDIDEKLLKTLGEI